jgi:hypothetical protein
MPLSSDILFQGAAPVGAIAANTSFFASNLVPKISQISGPITPATSSKFVITCSFTVTAPVIQISRDGGTTWSNLNSGTAIPTGNEFNITVMVHNGETINFRTTTSSVTITYFKVDEGV